MQLEMTKYLDFLNEQAVSYAVVLIIIGAYMGIGGVKGGSTPPRARPEFFRTICIQTSQC